MNEQTRPRILFNVIVCLGVAIFLGMAIVFSFRAVDFARGKDFWVDEKFGLEGTVRPASYYQLLTRGARGQGSAAPLDYVFIKALDQVYQKSFAYIPHNVYYRLNSTFWDLALGLLVAFLFLYAFYRKTDNNAIIIMQLVLIGTALLTFYFKKDNMYFAGEMRPYALWNSLWYVMLALVMLRVSKIWIFLTGIFLAFTSLGALMQIPALALVYFTFEVIDQKRPAAALREAALVFGLPFLIAVFYALQGDKFGYIASAADYQRYQNEFFSFWVSKWRVPFISGAGILLTAWNRQWRGCTAVFVTMLLLYGMAPALNYKILSSSFFFTSRQYLYYDLVFPLFYLMLALVLPEYWNMIFRLKNKSEKKS
ncbi:MAG: hypothetical protein HQL16_02485 [Candidatus Omnitrophica bacterium]|nr:hypothetical protein [Candidatus Omnitrophota bacterium]